MNNSVVIKGTTSGLTIVLDQSLPYKELRKEIIKKFQVSSNFLGQADIAITFAGRKLSNEELLDVIGIIHDNSMLNIVCVLHDDPEKDKIFERSIQNKLMEFTKNTAVFHKGSILEGKKLDFSSGVIVVGDVAQGATLTANGNVIVLGNVNGTVHAGQCGNKRAFITALDMNPAEIKIADYSYQSNKVPAPKHKVLFNKKTTKAMVAYVDLGKIRITEITNEIIHELRIE